MKDLNRVIVGNVVLHGIGIRKFLKKSCYSLSYDPEKETIPFKGDGGELLMEVRNASHESAVKLSEQLGLERSNNLSVCDWSKWNPQAELEHDGSEDADRLQAEIQKVGIPLKVRSSSSLVLLFGGNYRKDCGFSIDQMLNVVRVAAERYQSHLSTTP